MHWLLAMLVFAGGLLAEGKPLGFDQGDLGKLPAGWQAARTGQGEGSVWKVLADATAPSKSGHVLAQTAAGPKALFNLCLLRGNGHKDVEVTVAFKAVQGRIDQGGGILWRCQDANNYYIARYNPLENNFRLYKVVAGKRLQLQTRENLHLAAGTWHKLTIRMVGSRIECYLDGKKYLEAEDNTFLQPGQVGLWTKADAETYFDQLLVIDLKK